MKKLCYILCNVFLLIITLVNFSTVKAQTVNDVGVLSNLEDNANLYDYLNYYNYHLWKADHRYSIHDMYITKDEAVIVDLWNGNLGNIYLLKPGYTTNKGIEVGMDIQSIINNYGDTDVVQNSGSYYANYTGYVVLEYVSDKNEGLSFVVNKYTGKIVLIRYQKNRHGNSLVMSDIKKYNLLPYLK